MTGNGSPGDDTDEVLADGVASWLMLEALGERTVEHIMEGACVRMLGAGIPLARAFLAFRTLHPLFASVSLVWRRGGSVNTTGHLHGEAFTNDEWLRSPPHHLLSTRTDVLRRRLVGADALVDFPILEELQGAGITDYLAYAVSFEGHEQIGEDFGGVVGSWATDRPSGFGDWDIRQLLRLQRRLAVACKVQIKDQLAKNVLDTYLGPNAGRRVLAGQIKRGDGSRIHAVVWYSDLRESTRLAESIAPDRFLALLNAYFECTAGAVLAAGGEVLRFIGDAVLAIFPVGECDAGAERPAECRACALAIDAARDAERRLAALNGQRCAAGEEPIDFGLGLHVGEVTYGNIGVPERLEFTVVGPVANEVARIETLSKVLGRRVLASAEMAGYAPGQWEPLGEHALRGVLHPVTVHALRPEASAVRPDEVRAVAG